ncbi:MAG: diaminopimelate epimerase [Peptococcaceae bacterium]|nr:diaminopimelate epimerase [Peptococcaceae bacterium]
MYFSKMQGLGNDFVIVNGLEQKLPGDLHALAVGVCDRNFGVGADGFVVIVPSEHADIGMRMFNPDGSEAEMCGNAIRCIARYVYERGIINKKEIRVETLAGVMIPELIFDNHNQVTSVRVNMGQPRLEREDIPMVGDPGRVVAEELEVGGHRVKVTAVSMGNPHCVVFVPMIDELTFSTLGPALEKHEVFPKHTNVEFVRVLSRDEVQAKVWERGAGATLACGTGACAAAVASFLNGHTGRNVKVHLPGGPLFIEYAEDGFVYMTGPAEEVYEGQLKPGFLQKILSGHQTKD